MNRGPDRTTRVHLSDEEILALQAADFPTFLQMVFEQLTPDTPYQYNWHLDVIAHALEEVRAGRIKRLIINVPPRSLKSISASVALPAFWLGHDPSVQFICASYGQELADKHAFDCRAVMESIWYQALFPTRLLGTRRAVSDFQTTRNGGRLATSVGGVLTGRGADVIIIDDPLKPNEALSETTRNNTNQWVDGTVFSRLNNKVDGAMIVIMQRLHLDDLSGYLMEKGGWTVLSLPAIAEADACFRIPTVFGPRVYRRSIGQALHAAREPLSVLEELRRHLGEFNFSGQYQQAPVPMGGGMVKLDWIQRYAPHELPPQFDQIVTSWDTANKVGELNDFSVATTWGIKDKKIYLLDVFRRKVNYPDLKRAVIEQYERHKPTVILIEDRASGTQLIQELRQAGLFSAKAICPTGDKVMRLHAQTAAIENGIARFPQAAPWLDSYLVELTSFPKGRNDDQVDSTSQFLEWARAGLAEPGLIAYYRQLSQSLERGV